MRNIDVLSIRRSFCNWLTGRRDNLFPGTESERTSVALKTLGLDDQTIGRLADAGRVLTTLPHASPNVFFPRVHAAWYARKLALRDDLQFHLRVVLTHIDFSDLRSRPYAWWFLDQNSRLTRETLFSRNKKLKHVAVASQGPIGAVARACGTDRHAADLGGLAADRGVSYMVIMAAVERAAGLVVPGRTTYVPLNVLVEFFRDRIRHGYAGMAAMRWLGRLSDSGTAFRRIGASGLLQTTDDPGKAFIFDNVSNVALLGLLSVDGVIGGQKMAGYWKDVTDRIEFVNSLGNIATEAPRLICRPEPVNRSALPTPSPHLAGDLHSAGIGYSQGMALAEHGPFAEDRDPF